MKINRWTAGLVTAVLVGVMSVAGASTASAAPPVDQSATMGTVMFYDEAGNRIYSGDGTIATSPKYAVATGTTATPSEIKKASLFGYLPVEGQHAGNWSGMQLSATQFYPITSAPASVSSSPNPATYKNAGENTLKDLANTFPQTNTSPDYKDRYVLRLMDAESGEYAATFVTIDKTTGAWAQVDPAPPVDTRVATTTTLTVDPPSGAPAPADLTMTATVSDTTAPGTVEFFNVVTTGPSYNPIVTYNSLGTVTPTNGVATLSLADVPEGSYNYMARFTPTDMNAFMASNSNKVAYTVAPAPAPAADTTTTLSVDPAAGATAPADLTLTANVAPTAAAGSVEFFNGTTSLGTSAVTNGVATLAQNDVPAGDYSYTATFTPSDPAAYNGSTSAPVAYTVAPAPAPAADTTTTLSVDPAAGATAPADLTLTANVAPTAAAGSVEFFNGTTSLGTSTVTNGVATLAQTDVPAGEYSYTATFTPSDPAAYNGSTSAPVAYTVAPAPAPAADTTTTLSVDPAAGATAPADLTLTANVAPTAAAGSVEFFNGTTSLGTSAVTNGVATLAQTDVPAGEYSYTATFTPSDPAAYNGSTSAPVAYTVAPAPVAADTTTTLSVDPAAGATAPADLTLTANVAPTAAAGSVEFFNGTTSLGTSAVTNGVATLAQTDVPAGEYSYTATFTPSDPAAYNGSTSNTVMYTVNAPAPVTRTLTVTPQDPSIAVGKSVRLKATLMSSDSSRGQTVTRQSTWISSNPGVATVSSRGVVKGVAEGTATITARYTDPETGEMFEASTEVTVTPAPVKGKPNPSTGHDDDSKSDHESKSDDHEVPARVRAMSMA